MLGPSSTTVGVSASQMGDNLPAVNVGSGLDVLDVQAGETHTCALLTNNDVKCWGNNANGQLGQGSIVNLGDNIGEMSSLQSIDID
jgi:alpha-tubulin suppressor-like RCC1 family protein